MKHTLLRRAALPAALALSLGLAACSGANETQTGSGGDASASSSSAELSGDLNGAGASSQKAAMDAWVAGFTGANADANVNYDPAGSGAGRDQFLKGAVDFAGSDAYLKDEELETSKEACAGDAGAFDIPVYVSPIAVIYNLPGVSDLKLSAPTIAKIFSGAITTWDAPEIKADNPGATLPATPITPVHRADDSGTTTNFTDYLSKASEGAWTAEPDGEWPLPGGEAAQGTSGVVSAVKAGAGAIGYADLSQAGDLGVASVKVGDAYVAPTAETAAAVLDASPEAEGRPEHDIAIDIDRTTTAAGTYPLVLVSYHIACAQYEDAAQADLVKGFLSYVVSEEGQQAAASAAGSAPLSATLREEATASIEAIGSGS